MAISSAMSEKSKRKPHFFKVLLGDFKQRLKIPPKFMKHIKKEAFRRVILQGPSGSRWKIKLSETIEGNFLSAGWSKFVKDHSLNEHEFLIFRYEGNMHFSVMIFDTTACEREEASEIKTPKKSACERENKGSRPRKRSNDANCIVPHQSSRSKLLKPLSVIKHASKQLYGFGHEKQIGGGHEENTILDSSHPDSAIVCIGQHESPKSNRDYKITNEDAEILFSKPPSQTYFISRRRPVTTEERSIAKEAANSFHSPFPCTIVRMLKLHGEVTCMLKFPTCFSRKHLPCEKTSMILRDPCGREWIVAYTPFKGSLCDGWSDFIHGNRLEKGDFCAFELVGESEFRVTIFRVVEETTFLARLTAKSP